MEIGFGLGFGAGFDKIGVGLAVVVTTRWLGAGLLGLTMGVGNVRGGG